MCVFFSNSNWGSCSWVAEKNVCPLRFFYSFCFLSNVLTVCIKIRGLKNDLQLRGYTIFSMIINSRDYTIFVWFLNCVVLFCFPMFLRLIHPNSTVQLPCVVISQVFLISKTNICRELQVEDVSRDSPLVVKQNKLLLKEKKVKQNKL